MPTECPPESEFLRRADVARLLGVSMGTVEKWATRGCGPPFFQVAPPTSPALYPRALLEAWIAERLTNGSGRLKK